MMFAKVRQPFFPAAAALLVSSPLLASAAAARPGPIVFRNTGPAVAYVGSRACAACHPAIFSKYSATAMGRSVTPVAPGPGYSGVVRNESLNRTFSVSSDSSGVYQTESQGEGASQVFANTRQLAYVIGSGDNGKSFVVRRGDYLFQAPLSYYSRAARWDLSPGFETVDQGFNRPIFDACITCHAGRPQTVPHREGLFQNPPFAEAAIGCENCHGPGQLHIAEKSRGRRALPDTSIVNPARLPPRLAEDICLKCHQGGDTRALLPGKQYSDFRPGLPLLQTFAVVSRPLEVSQEDLLEHHVSMKLSRCFRATRGKLGCLTCHDPHEQPDAASAPAYFRRRCLTCHALQDCKVTHEPAANCIGCHMPKRDVQQISHSALTNHRIPARPDQVSPTSLPDSLSADLPGLLLLNASPGAAPLPEITRLSIYGELANSDPRFAGQYSTLLNRLMQTAPDDPLVLASWGRKALREKNSQALDYLSRAVEKGTPAPATIIDLSEALTQAGRETDAIAALERGVELHPYSTEMQKRLLLRYIQAKQYGPARTVLERYVKEFPEDSFMRRQLEHVQAATPY